MCNKRKHSEIAAFEMEEKFIEFEDYYRTGNKNIVYIFKIWSSLYEKPFIKMGFTVRDPLTRLKELNCEYKCDGNIEVLCLHHVPGIWVELDFHRMYKHKQIKNITGSKKWEGGTECYDERMLKKMVKYLEKHTYHDYDKVDWLIQSCIHKDYKYCRLKKRYKELAEPPVIEQPSKIPRLRTIVGVTSAIIIGLLSSIPLL